MSKRDEFVTKMKAQLDEWNSEIAKLEAKISEKTGPAREKLEPQLEKVRESYRKGRAKLDELGDATEDRFDKVKGEAEHVWKALRQSVNYFRSQL